MPHGHRFIPAFFLLVVLCASSPARAWLRTDLPVSDATGAKRQPQLVTDGASGVFVGWNDWRTGSTDRDVYLQHLRLDGSVAPGWAPGGRPIATGAGEQSLQFLIADGAGGGWIGWIDRADWSGGFLRLLHFDAAGEPAPGWPAGGLYLTSGYDNLVRATAANDRAGGLFLLWEIAPVTDPAFVRGTRLHADGTLASGWPAGGDLPLTSAATSLRSAVPVALGAGAFAVAWIDARSGGASVYAQRLLGDGSRDPAWPAAALPIATQPATASGLLATADAVGGLLLAWWDNRAGAQDLYAQRVLANGIPPAGWPSQGRRLTAVSQLNPTADALAADGTSSLLAWIDGPGVPRLQRLDAGGAVPPGWPAAGVTPALAKTSSTLALAPDGAAGAYAAWCQTDSSGSTSTRLAHVDAAGALSPDWPAAGLVLSAGTGSRREPALAWTGGFLATVWQGPLAVNPDVVAAFVTPGSAPPLAAPAPALAALTLAPLASPLAGAPALRVRLAGPGTARVELLDVSGRRLAASVPLAGPLESVVRFAPVPPGVYLARVVQNERSVSTRLVVLD